MSFHLQTVSIKIEKDDDQFTKHETSEPVSKASNSDTEDIDIKPQRSRSPSQTWGDIIWSANYNLNCTTMVAITTTTTTTTTTVKSVVTATVKTTTTEILNTNQ